MKVRPLSMAALAAGAMLIIVACVSDVPTDAPAAAAAAPHHGAIDFASASPAVRAKLVELRQWSAPFHNPANAAEAGYLTSIGCLDETLIGVPRESARGMGYHIGGGADGLGFVDLTIDLMQPEFLVYAPTKAGGSLETARLVALDYFQPDPTDDNTLQPAPLLGTPFQYSAAFDGWIAHIYLWGNNPEGMFENWNGAVPLCTAE